MSAFRNRIEELLHNNAEYAKSFTGAPAMSQMRAQCFAENSLPMAILTCLDPRCVPETFFGLGTSTAVLRNAGGRASDDAVRSLNVLRALVNIKMVVVVHHTDCGVSIVTEDEIREYSKSKNPDAGRVVDKIDFKLWKEENLADTVREDVRKLRDDISLSGMQVYGFVLDTQTGITKEVDV
ncbi:carbonic anhydrase [Xylogone sp. PMI_703]|nr:carbonic anhydrase [Xylogone sp. PMI_703]